MKKEWLYEKFLVFDEEVRDILLESDPNEVTSATRKLVKQRGQLMTQDAKRNLKKGLLVSAYTNWLLLALKNINNNHLTQN